MAVGTQKPKIPMIQSPISKSPAPTVDPFFWFVLCLWVNVVDVQNANIAVTARCTFSTEFFNQLQLPLPNALRLVNAESVFVPKGSSALSATKAIVARLSAPSALAATAPSVGKVALPPAVFTSAIPKSVRVHRRRLIAIQTNDRRWCGSHAVIIADRKEPKYFKIACERIQSELDRTSLFEPAPKIVQRSLLGEDAA